MRSIFRSLFALTLILSFSCLPSTQARAALMTQIDWISLWGNINPETGIPTDQHEIKAVIASAVDRCGVGNTNYDLFKVYKSSSKIGYVYFIDASLYFGAGQSTSCTGKPCTSDGCYFTVMGPQATLTETYECEEEEEETEKPLIEQASEEEETTCTKTSYKYPVLKDARALTWSLMSLASYDVFRANTLDALGNTKYRATYNGTNPVLKTQLASGCTIDEMDTNNDGEISSTEPCYKYYQLEGTTFKDLYSPQSSEEVEDDTRYTITYFDRETAQVESGSDLWRSEGLRLASNSQISIQIPDFLGTGKVLCKNIENISENGYFLPTKTDEEIDAFLKAVEAENVDGVTASDCTRQYTEWVGTLVCPSVPCGQTITIVAQRFCQRSSSAYGDCDECGPEICFLKQTCSGGSCGKGKNCIGPGQKILMADGSYKNIEEIEIGNEVMSFTKDAVLGSLKPARVKKILKTDFPEVLEKKAVMINGIVFTGNHDLPTLGKKRIMRADQIEKTSQLVGISGEAKTVKELSTPIKVQDVYNLRLEGADGYVVNGLRVYASF